MGKWEALVQFALFRPNYLLSGLISLLAEVIKNKKVWNMRFQQLFLCFDVNLKVFFFFPLIFSPSYIPFPANFPESVVENLPADIGTGIYYGWASLGNGDVYKMVMSIGWNPFYKNTKKSMVSSPTCQLLIIMNF